MQMHGLVGATVLAGALMLPQVAQAGATEQVKGEVQTIKGEVQTTVGHVMSWGPEHKTQIIGGGLIALTLGGMLFESVRYRRRRIFAINYLQGRLNDSNTGEDQKNKINDILRQIGGDKKLNSLFGDEWNPGLLGQILQSKIVGENL